MQIKIYLSKIFRASLFLGLFVLLTVLFIGSGYGLIKIVENRNHPSQLRTGRAGNIPDSAVDSAAGPSTLKVNAHLDVMGQLYITPSILPETARAGTLAFDQLTGSLNYHDGNGFVRVAIMDDLEALQAPQDPQFPPSSEVSSITSLPGHINVQTTAGAVSLSLPQTISTSSTPTFAAINLASPLDVSDGGTGSNNAADARASLGAAASGVNADITATTTLNTVTPSSDLTLGTAGELFILQGSAASTIAASANGFTTSLGFATPVSNSTLNFPALPLGSYEVCTSSGNCVGGGGGAPDGASYLTLGLAGDLSSERILSSGTNISFADGGANGNLTISTVGNPTFSTSVTTPSIQSAGALAIVPGGALTVGATTQQSVFQGATVGISSNGMGSDVTITSSDQVILSAGSTIELQDDTNVNGALVASSTIEGDRLISMVATGTAPLTVSSTTLVNNFNADLLDGQQGSYYLSLANATGTLGMANGGTGLTTCGNGTVLKSNGTAWTCGTDNNTTYGVLTNGGLQLSGTSFGLIGCTNGQVLKATATANQWACNSDTDTNTTYSAGSGLNLNGTSFRLTNCSVGQVMKSTGSFTWGCAADTDTNTTYSGADFIQNQFSFYQSANMAITGTIRTTGAVQGNLYIAGGASAYANHVCFGTPTDGYHPLGSCTASSARYKHSVHNLTGGLSDIRQLRPVTFYYNEDYAPDVPEEQLGFIAEEVAAINPIFALYRDGQIETVNYDKLTAVLALGIQQLDVQARSDANRLSVADTRLNLIDGRLAVLEGKTSWPNIQVMGTAAINNLKVAGLTEVADIKVSGKIVSAGSPATAVLGAQAASGGSVSITGNDAAGTFSYVSSGGSVGEQIRIDFAQDYASQPRISLTPKNGGAGALSYYVITLTTGFTVYFLDAPEPGLVYDFDYLLIQ